MQGRGVAVSPIWPLYEQAPLRAFCQCLLLQEPLGTHYCSYKKPGTAYTGTTVSLVLLSVLALRPVHWVCLRTRTLANARPVTGHDGAVKLGDVRCLTM
jgi:hypothetical protein